MTIVVPSFWEGSSSFLQVTSITVKAWMSLNFGQIPSLNTKLAALEHLKNIVHQVSSAIFYSDLFNSCR